MGKIIDLILNSYLFWKLPYQIRYLFNKFVNFSSFKSNQWLRYNKNEFNSSLIKFDDLKCIYVHIPKAGGVSINQSLFESLGGGHKSIKDYSLIFNKKTFETYYKFTIVRNPIDRVASAYFFLQSGGFHETDYKWFIENLSKYKNINDFIENWLTKKNIYSWVHFIPQFEFITINNQIVINDIFKIENISKDFKQIKQTLNLNNITLEELNTTQKKINYRKELNENSIMKIKNIYKKDFELLNYKL